MDFEFIRKRITELRLSKSMTEYQLSTTLGQSKSYIQGITSGKSLPSMKQLYNICDFFGITPADFFDNSEGSTPLYCKTANVIKSLDEADMQLILNYAQRIKNLSAENAKLRNALSDVTLNTEMSEG